MNTAPRYKYALLDHLGNAHILFSDLDGDGKLTLFDDPSTDAEEVVEAYQESHYYPFGMLMEGPFAPTLDIPDNYLYNTKEFNADFGLNWYDYGARWHDPAIGRWGAVDPLAEKYSPFSPYNYTLNNPVRFLDPDGMGVDDIIFYNTKGEEVHRVVSETVNEVYVINSDDGTQAFNTSRNLIQGANTVETAQMYVEMASSDFSEATGVSLRFTGSANEDNAAQADGTLSVMLQWDDGEVTVSSYSAISGPYGNGALENGDYEVGRVGAPRNPSSAYIDEGVAFTVDLEPTFDTGRTLLRIHPDGNVAGTAGCVGLTGCTADELTTFYSNMRTFTEAFDDIQLSVDIENNPNNDGRQNEQEQ